MTLSIQRYGSNIFGARPAVHMTSVEASGLKDEVTKIVEDAVGYSFSIIGDTVEGFSALTDLFDGLDVLWTRMANSFGTATGYLNDIKRNLDSKLSDLGTKLTGIETQLQRVGDIPGAITDTINTIPTFDEAKAKVEDVMVNFVGGIFDGIAFAMESGLQNLQRQVGGIQGFSADDRVTAMDLFTRIRNRSQAAGQKVTTAVFQFFADLSDRVGLLLISLHPDKTTWKAQYQQATRLDTKLQILFDAYFQLLMQGAERFYENIVVPAVRKAFEVLGNIITPIAEGVWAAIASAFAGWGDNILEAMGIRHSWGGLNRAVGIEHPMWQVATFFGTTLVLATPLAFLYDRGFIKLLDYTADRIGGAVGSVASKLLGGGG